jgi:hypothetical protein
MVEVPPPLLDLVSLLDTLAPVMIREEYGEVDGEEDGDELLWSE